MILQCARTVLGESAIKRLDELNLTIEDFMEAMQARHAKATGMLKGHNFFPLERCLKYAELLDTDPGWTASWFLAQHHSGEAVNIVKSAFQSSDTPVADAWVRLIIAASNNDPRPPTKMHEELLRTLFAGETALRGR